MVLWIWLWCSERCVLLSPGELYSNNLWLLGSYSVDIPTKEPCRQAETMEVPSNLNGWMSSRSGSRLGAPFVVLCIQVRRDLDQVDERNNMR